MIDGGAERIVALLQDGDSGRRCVDSSRRICLATN